MGRKTKARRYVLSGRRKMGQVKGKFRELRNEDREDRPVKKRLTGLRSLPREVQTILRRSKRRRESVKKKLAARRSAPTRLKRLRSQAFSWKNG